MKNKFVLLLVVGIICLAAGGYFYMKNNDGSVDQKNIEIARHATNAADAAREMSANNRGEVGGHALAMGLLGFGGVLTLASIFVLVKNPKKI